MTINLDFAGTPVTITDKEYIIDKNTKNDAVKIYLYLKDTYFSPKWKYDGGITLPYFLPNMKKGDS